MQYVFICCVTGIGSVSSNHNFLFLPVSDPSNQSDDGTFDIITEEEVNGVYDSDAASQTTAGSMDGEQAQQPQGALNV